MPSDHRSGCCAGHDNRRHFGEARVIALPTDIIVDQYSAPLISSSGDVAFVSSVMSGALISLSVASGKILSWVTCGEIAGIASMVETDKRRLIVLPTANDPDHGHPATSASLTQPPLIGLRESRRATMRRSSNTCDSRITHSRRALWSDCVELQQASVVLVQRRKRENNVYPGTSWLAIRHSAIRRKEGQNRF